MLALILADFGQFLNFSAHLWLNLVYVGHPLLILPILADFEHFGLILGNFEKIPETDGQTDKQSDRQAYQALRPLPSGRGLKIWIKSNLT